MAELVGLACMTCKSRTGVLGTRTFPYNSAADRFAARWVSEHSGHVIAVIGDANDSEWSYREDRYYSEQELIQEAKDMETED